MRRDTRLAAAADLGEQLLKRGPRVFVETGEMLCLGHEPQMQRKPQQRPGTPKPLDRRGEADDAALGVAQMGHGPALADLQHRLPVAQPVPCRDLRPSHAGAFRPLRVALQGSQHRFHVQREGLVGGTASGARQREELLAPPRGGLPVAEQPVGQRVAGTARDPGVVLEDRRELRSAQREEPVRQCDAAFQFLQCRSRTPLHMQHHAGAVGRAEHGHRVLADGGQLA
ncbi:MULTISPECIES: hypothetical protein [unclassified Streptomyces]|uniref:hypothetical protein n=1 Tax=unclassified Streptomyces TaxID=2593676 RepID=UPI002E26C4C5